MHKDFSQVSSPTILLGIDYGAKRIGVAVGNRYTQTATPLETVTNRQGRPNWEAMDQLIKAWQPQAFVVGMVYYQDQTPHPLGRQIQSFCDKLRHRYALPVYQVVEYASSVEAVANMTHAYELGLRKRVRKEDIDPVSAALLIEQWFSESSKV